MSKRNGDRSRTNRQAYKRRKNREAIIAFTTKTEFGQALVRGLAAERAAKAAAAAAPAL